MGTPATDLAVRTVPDFGVGRLFWSLRDAAVVGDTSTGRIVLWNAAAESMFGYTAEEAVGQPIEMLIPDSLATRHQAGLARYRQTGRGPLIDSGLPVELSARRKTGEEIWIELTLSPLDDEPSTGRFVVAMVRDATTRKLAESERAARLRAESERAEVEQRASVAVLSAEVGQALTHGHTLGEGLGRSADVLARHMDAILAHIWTLNEGESILELQASAGLDVHLDESQRRVAIGHDMIGRIGLDRRQLVTNDLGKELRGSDDQWASRDGLVAFAGYPLLVEQRLVGIVALYARRALEPYTLDAVAGVVDGIAQYIERKRVQEALQHSEQRFRALIEHAQDIITILDENGTILYESPAVEAVLGLQPTELVGKNAFDLVHPDDRSGVWETFTGLVGRPGATTPTFFRFRHADGSWRWLEAVGHNLLADPAVSGIVVNSRDVTNRKDAEEALQRSEEHFRKLIERSSDMITLHRRDGTITYVSPSTRGVLGYEPGDLLEHSLLDTVHPEDRAALAQVILNLEASPGESSMARYRMRHVDGSWRWIESTGTNLLDEPAVGAIVVNRRDVTSEVEAQQQLERRVSERTRELATLLEVSRGMGSMLELRSVITFIFDQLKTIVDYSALRLHLLLNGEYKTIEYRGPLPRERMLANRNSPRIVELIDAAASQGSPVILDDFGGNTPIMQRFEAEGLVLPPEAYGHARAVMCAPLMSQGRHVGGLMLMHRVAGYYTARHAEYVVAFGQHAAAAIENAQLYEAVHDKAALEERQRLARELHDSVSQALYAIALNTAAVEESLRKQDAPRAKRLTKQVRQLARGGLAEMRALIFELRAESLAEEGLVAALTKQAAAVEARHELKLRLTLSSEPALPLPAKEALYRIAQEALHNVVKHANSRTAELSLHVADSEVVLTIRDRGRGFNPDGSFPGHLGLRSMRERAHAIGATLSLRSTPEVGTEVCVRVPVPPASGG